MEIKLNIPDSLNEISLNKYQKYLEIAKNSEDSFFLMQKCISIFCEIPMQVVLTMRYTDVETICANILALFDNKNQKLVQKFTLNGVVFGFIPCLEDMTIGEFPDIDTNFYDINNFNKALAVLYRPITKEIGNTYEIEAYNGTNTYSDVMKYAPMDVVLGARVFFWTLSKDLLTGSTNFLKNLQNQTQKQTSAGTTDGIAVFINSLKEISLKLEKQPKLI